MNAQRSSLRVTFAFLASLIAVAVALLLAQDAVPDAVLYHQLTAVCGWGLWLLASWRPEAGPGRSEPGATNGSLPLAMGALGVLVVSGAGTMSVVAVMLCGALITCATVYRGRLGADAVGPMAGAWAIAGLGCAAVASVQYFAAGAVDLPFVAAGSAAGRAVGNMRQPNHLATALVCAMVWTTWLGCARRLPASIVSAAVVVMVFAVALSASRTGALSLGVLLLWAVVDTRLPRGARWLLALTPLIYLACWFGLAEWATLAQGHYYGADRLQSAGDPSSSRLAIWTNALTLVGMHPWTGVGWGNFNVAWTFTPFPDRPRAFFDHTHNLPLQLAVEIGLPATAAVLGLLGWALWRARGAWFGAPSGPDAKRESPARAAFVMLVVLGVHSMLEYPLWYAYFLLPAAWALGLFIGSAPVSPRSTATVTARSWPAWLLAGCGAAMIVGSIYALWDHRRIERIFEAAPGAAPLAERIADGRRSRLFGHHADYAAVTNEPRDTALASFRRPLLQLVDVRLMTAYIEALKAAGEDRKALYAAQRLREFQRDDAQAYFKDCDTAEPPFQCERAPVTGLTWRNLLPP